jgi:thymidylate synthase
MRFFSSFREANNEIRRDLAELGTSVHPQTMQDKDIANDPGYDTRELLNYSYTVIEPELGELHPSQPWADEEFEERISFVNEEHAEAWKLRPEVWQEFANRGFSYTYGERYFPSLESIIGELKEHPESRQLYMSVWDPILDADKLGKLRVPCSLGYWFVKRGGRLHMTYMQRSADFATHFENDQYLSYKLQRYVAEQAGVPAGRFTHWIGSLHVYQKDVAGVF